LGKHIAHAVGSLQVPMTDEQLTAKFIDQVSLVVGTDAATRWSEKAWNICNSRDITADIRR
jgi:hypothetical protein